VVVTIFSLEEAREFQYQGQTPLEDETRFPDEMIEDAAERITEQFADICDVSFVPVTGATKEFDGNGEPYLLGLPPLVSAVSTVESWNGSTWVASGLTYRLLGDGSLLGTSRWPWGRANLRATFDHGYTTPPRGIKRAALILAVEQLAGSNISARATQQTNENGTFNLAVPGWRENQWFGLPEVDSALADERAKHRRMVG
jgi:hypothetical protein